MKFLKFFLGQIICSDDIVFFGRFSIFIFISLHHCLVENRNGFLYLSVRARGKEKLFSIFIFISLHHCLVENRNGFLYLSVRARGKEKLLEGPRL